jgi:uncharacterized protein YozE (UPF0346 family)
MKNRQDYSPIVSVAELQHRQVHFKWDGTDYNGVCVYLDQPCYFHWYSEVFDNPNPWIKIVYTDYENDTTMIEVCRTIPGARIYALRPIDQEVVDTVVLWHKLAREVYSRHQDKATKQYDEDMIRTMNDAGLDRSLNVSPRRSQLFRSSVSISTKTNLFNTKFFFREPNPSTMD